MQAVEQGGQEPADVAVAGRQLLGPRLGFSGQLADGVDRGGELVTGDAALFQQRPHREEAAVGWVNTPPECAAVLAELIPAGELLVQPGAAHFPWLDDPDRFTADLDRFLRDPTVQP